MTTKVVYKMRDRDKDILENNKVYTIPDDISILMDKEYLETFLEEIHKITGNAIDMFGWTYLFNLESTAGWHEAFKSTCNKTNKGEIIYYYRTLPWELSDCFDDLLFDLLEKNKLILPGTEDDEVGRQNGIKGEEVYPCYGCGNYFKKEDMFEDESSDENLYYCIECHCKELKTPPTKKIKPLHFDRKEALKYHLNLTKDDIFYCESCKRYHLKKFEYKKGLCEYCNITNNSKNSSANDYYQALIKEELL